MKKVSPYLLLSVIIFLWGSNFVVSRYLSGIPPVRVSGVFYALFRYFFGTLTMVAILALQRKGPRTIVEEIRGYRGLLGLSALFSALFVLSIHSSTEYISSGTTSIIVNLCPVVVLAYSAVKLKEKITPAKIAGFILGFAGGVLLLFNNLAIEMVSLLGIAFAIMGMFSWGAYTVTLHYLEGADRYIVMMVKHLVSSLMIIPFIVLLSFQGLPLILIFDAVSIAGMLYAGILASGLAYVLYFAAIEILGAAKASSFLFLVPFVSVIGDFILGEPPGIVTILAGTTALIGVALIRMVQNGPKDASMPIQTD
ncbi:MAG: DMT family transporter [Candidatus Thorarchaeota archaeon]|nr:DMT family transporter [Candidatus Thorarchaeota archaeon]